MFALTFQGKVVQIEAAQFPVHSALVWVDIGANLQGVVPSWSYDGVIFAAPVVLPPPPPPTKAARLQAAFASNAVIEALLRREAGTRGTTVAVVLAELETRLP
jgi:hypothetical protein